jgi:hypothetical protein
MQLPELFRDYSDPGSNIMNPDMPAPDGIFFITGMKREYHAKPSCVHHKTVILFNRLSTFQRWILN